jgi:hypothetical protein
MPELVFPPFGTSGLLPEFVSADSDMLLSRLWHDASSDVRSPVAAVFGGSMTGPRRAMMFTARGINSIYSGEFRDSLKPRSIFYQGSVTGQTKAWIAIYLSRLGAGDAGFIFRAADVSCLQAQDGLGAHFTRQARLRRAHFRMQHLPPLREDFRCRRPNEDGCPGLAGRRTQAATFALSTGAQGCAYPVRWSRAQLVALLREGIPGLSVFMVRKVIEYRRCSTAGMLCSQTCRDAPVIM